ncbi:MAG TPA: LysR substrate-binding domain-containing protein [Caulobacteraceae bacterium]|nr:LysR substrate-binding domain-containing protein [Caulobacteraceae bacterium]
MASRPPPFAGLRVLEVACRLRSYSLTGEELGVTHSAVSQTVRRLEEAYGFKLFRRQGMRMNPTEPALALAKAYLEAARIVDRAAADLTAGQRGSQLVISTVASIAKLWFSPRLKRLHQALPDLAVEVRTGRDYANFETDGVDIAMRFGDGDWPGLHVEPLFDEIAFPVASPDFVARHGAFGDARLRDLPLILEDTPLWETWFATARVEPPRPLRGLAFDDAAMVVEAAAAGLGVALVRRIHAEAYLESGRLVRVSDTTMKTPQSCYLVWRDDSPRILAIRRFADWLLRECHASGLLEAA